MANLDRKRKSKEMRVRRVPIEVHKAIVAHQGLLAQKSEESISLDDAAIDLWRKAIVSIPALNQ